MLSRSGSDLSRLIETLIGASMLRAVNDYQVGYGKPPTASQFKKGERRPRKPELSIQPYLRQLLIKELRRSTEVVIEGRRMKLTKAEILVKRVVDQSIAKPSPQLLQILVQTLAQTEPSDPQLEPYEKAEIDSMEIKS